MFISLTVLNRVVLNDQMTSEEERITDLVAST